MEKAQIDTDDCLRIEAGWKMIGRDEKEVCLRKHKFFCKKIAVRRSSPFLTIGDARSVMVNGDYRAQWRKGKGKLRKPDEIFNGLDIDLKNSLTGCNWHEVNTLCRLIGGRLASEKEVNVILTKLADQSFSFDNVQQTWTRTRWHPLSYCLCRYDSKKECWIAPHDRELPVLPEDKNHIFFSIFDIRKPYNRFSADATLKNRKTGAMVVF